MTTLLTLLVLYVLVKYFGEYWLKKADDFLGAKGIETFKGTAKEKAAEYERIIGEITLARRAKDGFARLLQAPLVVGEFLFCLFFGLLGLAVLGSMVIGYNKHGFNHPQIFTLPVLVGGGFAYFGLRGAGRSLGFFRDGTKKPKIKAKSETGMLPISQPKMVPRKSKEKQFHEL
jgi:hypothetical protein